MKKEIMQKIEIPEGVEVNLEENILTVKGPEGENQRKFGLDKIILEKKGNEIIVGSKKATKKEKKKINSIKSHIENMIKGVQKKFEYKLKMCFSHFPFTIDIKEDKAVIKNFLGEKKAREMPIKKGVEIKINKEIIDILSCNKELAGQTAADFERITKVRKKDRRIFQDGIFITSKMKGKAHG